MVRRLTAERAAARRWDNYRMNAAERAEGKTVLNSMPISVMIPTGQRCNLRCRMCIDRSNPEAFRDLSFDEFLQFDHAIQVATTLAIYGWGEPLVNPEYSRMFDHITSEYSGIILHVSTNGVLLDDDWRRKLVNTTNCFLNVSINAANRDTYRSIMGADAFEKVVCNLRSLGELKQKTGSYFPVLTVSFVMQIDNISELPEFFTLAEDLGADDVLISDLIVLGQTHQEMSVRASPQAALAAYRQAKAIAATGDSGTTLTQFTDVPFLPPEHGNVCTDPWESMKIGSDGSVSICCYANPSFGNVFEQDIREIWNSELIQHYRATVNTGNPPRPCRTCPKKAALFQDGSRETANACSD